MIKEFQDYLISRKVDFTFDAKSACPVFVVGDLAIVLVALDKCREVNLEDYADYGRKRLFLYEDRWRSNNDNVKRRIDSHIGRGTTFSARNGAIRSITYEQSKSFLSDNHSYGAVKAKYYYGFFDKDDRLLAVSVFSASRDMNRDGITVASYEWVRYASLPDLRVVGGMDKFLKHFIRTLEKEQEKSIEIMSYADREWSEGAVYEKLGFRKVGLREKLEFFVDKNTMERISARKLQSDKKFRFINMETKDYYSIMNLGSVKYLFLKTQLSK